MKPGNLCIFNKQGAADNLTDDGWLHSNKTCYINTRLVEIPEGTPVMFLESHPRGLWNKVLYLEFIGWIWGTLTPL